MRTQRVIAFIPEGLVTQVQALMSRVEHAVQPSNWWTDADGGRYGLVSVLMTPEDVAVYQEPPEGGASLLTACRFSVADETDDHGAARRDAIATAAGLSELLPPA